jgi:hypothetical protein
MRKKESKAEFCLVVLDGPFVERYVDWRLPLDQAMQAADIYNRMSGAGTRHAVVGYPRSRAILSASSKSRSA